jgi:hypothetical protein
MATGDAGQATIVHECARFDAINAVADPDFHWYGMAINRRLTWVASARAWRADNGEYAVAVAFCPWCGLDLMTLVPKEG